MNIQSTAFLFAAFLLFSWVHAHEGHDHHHEKIVVGPHGGRVLTSVEPWLEFLITEDRRVRFTALNKDLTAIPMAKQSIRVTGGDRQNPTRMTFAKEGDSLVSDVAFPAGNSFPVVIQIKVKVLSKPILERFHVNLDDCADCEFRRYACARDHHHDHKH
ncbi:MAG: hypothetical protein AAF191_20605 [Verrucomicrobiota bacterium]